MKPGPVNPVGLKRQSYYNHALVRHGQAVYLTGQIACDAEGNLVGPGDIDRQAVQIWDNIRLLLDALGVGPQAVVKLTTYALSRESIPALHRARQAFFEGHDLPASTFVVVAGLADPGLLAEIDATVILPMPPSS